VLVLDTDHLVEYQKGTSPEATRLKARLDTATEPVATTIISVEEILRGWMAAIRRSNDPHGWIVPYKKLQQLFRFFATWKVLEWSDGSAAKFSDMRKDKVRIGSMDLRIASISLANDSTLLTANTGDFEQVPGLRVANWLS
jgi:tRNA(fMet)-specific endonuclease VapC